MSSRLSCWLHGHDWRTLRKGSRPRLAEDIFGNLWRLRRCHQCGAHGKVLYRSRDVA